MGGVASEGLPAQGREGFLHHRHQAGALGAPQVQGWECQLARGIHPGVLQRVGDLQARALLHNARAAYHASVHVLLHGKVGGGCGGSEAKPAVPALPCALLAGAAGACYPGGRVKGSGSLSFRSVVRMSLRYEHAEKVSGGATSMQEGHFPGCSR